MAETAGSKAAAVRGYVLAVLKQKQAATTVEIGDDLGLPYRDAYGALVHLYRQDRIDRTTIAGSVLWISKDG